MKNITTKLGALLAAGATAAMVIGAAAAPATADSLPVPGCTTDCVAFFDTIGSGFSFDVPAAITELTVTVAGGAGAPQPVEITLDPTAVGGAGGATTVDLGTAYAGATLYFGVGGTGGGSYLGSSIEGLVIAGGGGGGGYVGRLDLPDQVFGAFPGGAGASPVVAGTTLGEDATAYASNAANGLGGAALGGGPGGTGDAIGTAGENTSTFFPTSIDLAEGGDGGTLLIEATEHTGGAGGGGFTGGGGGAVERGIDAGDEILVDLVAPGGGGSGMLADGLTGVAAEPNTGTGYVEFTYTVAVPPTPALPATGAGIPALAPWAALGALLVGGFALMISGRRRRA